MCTRHETQLCAEHCAQYILGLGFGVARPHSHEGGFYPCPNYPRRDSVLEVWPVWSLI